MKSGFFVSEYFNAFPNIERSATARFFHRLRPSLRRYLIARSGLRLLRLFSIENRLRPFGLKKPAFSEGRLSSALSALRHNPIREFHGSGWRSITTEWSHCVEDHLPNPDAICRNRKSGQGMILATSAQRADVSKVPPERRALGMDNTLALRWGR